MDMRDYDRMQAELELAERRHEDAVYIDRILNTRQNWLRILFDG